MVDYLIGKYILFGVNGSNFAEELIKIWCKITLCE